MSHRTQILAWHGWQLSIPNTWNPVRVDGDVDQGYVLLADLQSARLGLRWRKASKRGDPAAWANKALVQEVGKLAADEAKPHAMSDASAWKVSRLYADPEPPGRDVWVGWSGVSNRVMEIVYHAKTRDRVLADDVLPSLTDAAPAGEQLWSIFDLSCRSPAGWELQNYRLNAGDLALTFRRKRDTAVVRQIAPATLALARQSLDQWLNQQPKAIRKLYRDVTDLSDWSLDLTGRSITGRRGRIVRRRRLFWAFTLPKIVAVVGAQDAQRNRLLLGQGSDERVIADLLATVGWAKGGPSTTGPESE